MRPSDQAGSGADRRATTRASFRPLARNARNSGVNAASLPSTSSLAISLPQPSRGLASSTTTTTAISAPARTG